jgi:DNA-binding transcriptional LysR family regulator
VEAEIGAIKEFSVKPRGTVRITSTDYAVDTAIWPRLAALLADYPELKVEITVGHGLTDVVTQRYELGIRNGDQVAKDMAAVRIGPDTRMTIVGAPSYLDKYPEPKRPEDLLRHNCLALPRRTRAAQAGTRTAKNDYNIWHERD